MTSAGARPPAIRLRGVTKQHPSPNKTAHTALRDVDLAVGAGEFVAVVGPTGCGKSTMLSLVAGLDAPSAGEVRVHDRPVTGVPAGLGYVFQQDAVLPWRTVLDNVAAGPRWRGQGKREAHELARSWIARVGLEGFEDHHPHQLSGGMRKRVSLAQTLINAPTILLMDEPFGALDVQTRELMQDLLLALWAESGAAVLFVTHDLTEAIALADSVVVMTAGPATVKATVPVRLERPRRVEDIRMEDAFLATYRQVWEPLKEEVAVTRGRGFGHVA
jgi:NitT/TauT family transport system ATP-binding protein